jgi:hypothetical protein
VVKVNLYKAALDHLVDSNKLPDGSLPVWIQSLGAVFNFGKKFAKVINKVESGELALPTDLLPAVVPM